MSFLNLFYSLLFCLLMLSSTSLSAEEKATKVDNIVLQTAEGSGFELYKLGSYQVIVMVAQTNGCPILRKYSDKLKLLKEKFQNSAAFYLVNANIQDLPLSIKNESERIDYRIPILIDKGQQLSSQLGLTKASEVVMIDPKTWTVLYRGAIDDSQNYDIEKTSSIRDFLQENIESYLADKKIIHTESIAFGCAIFYDESKVTYNKDIAAIYNRRCLQCHSSGAMFPDLSEYQKVKAWSKMSAEQIKLKKMPPVSLDIDSNFARYAKPSHLVLTGEEERKIFNWTVQNCEEGTGKAPKFKKTTKAAVVTTSEFSAKDIKVPAKGILSYRYNEMAGPTLKDMWIERLQFYTDSDYFHHAHLMFLPHPLEYYQKNKLMEEMHFQSKYKNKNIISWSPSAFRSANENWISFPQSTALLIPKGSYLILESHLKTTGEAGSAKMTVRFSEIKPTKKTKKIFIGFLSKMKQKNGDAVTIPAGQQNFSLTESYTVDQNISIIRVTLHTHLRGVSMKMRIIDHNNNTKTIVSSPNYAYKKLGFADFAESYDVKKGSTIELVGEYDNSKYNYSNPDPTKEIQFGTDVLTQEMLKAEYLYTLK